MIIGHEKQVKYFKNLIKNDILGHAYLFTGPEKIGKKTFALELAIQILGNIQNNPDFKFMEPNFSEGESKIHIEDIRDLRKFLSFKSYNGGQRVVLLNDAHFLTNE